MSPGLLRSPYPLRCLDLVLSQVQPLGSLFPECNPLAVDLLQKLLVFDPSQRLTVRATVLLLAFE